MSVTFEVSAVPPNPASLVSVSARTAARLRGVRGVEAGAANGEVSLPITPSELSTLEGMRGRRADDLAEVLDADPRHGRRAALALNGFVAALDVAFNRHVPLTLSPDDVWLCVAQGFAHHVSLHAEALRARFVRHEGKAALSVRRDDFRKGYPDNPWPEAFAAFSDQISAHVGKKRDLVVADFSTTGPVERAASEVVLLDAVRSYFDYQMMSLCGIPTVTLLGIVDDWRRMKTRVEALAEFDLGWWTAALLPVMDQLIAAARGRADAEFWQSIYKLKQASGGPYVTGWCNTLFPYVKGHRSSLVRNVAATEWERGLDGPFGGGPTPDGIPVGLSRAPFVWNHLGTEYAMEFVGGFLGVMPAEGGSVRPCIGWAVCDETP